MSFMAMEAALRMVDVTDATARHVALMLGYRQNPDTLRCDPSIPGLAKDTGLNRSTVIRKLQYLEKIGKIEIIDRVKNGRQTTNTYRLIFAEGWTQNKPDPTTDNRVVQPAHEEVEGSQRATGGVAHCDGGGGTLRPEPKDEPKENLKRESDDSSKKGSRLSENWTLPEPWGTWALKQNLLDKTIRSQADCFRDYWISVPGQRGVKLNWEATWRNWIRSSMTRGAFSNGGPSGRPEPWTASDEIMKNLNRGAGK